MKFLITGCAGFIGSSITEHLLHLGHHVLGIDNYDSFYSITTKDDNIKSFAKHPNFTLYYTNMLSCDLRKTLTNSRIDCVIHLAASPGVLPSFKNPIAYQINNTQATLLLLNAMRDSGVKNGVFASSSSVYGNGTKLPFSEEDKVEPVSVYGTTKLALEGHCRSYANAYDMNLTCLRFFTCYGPRQRPDLAIHKFSRLMLNSKPIVLYGDGQTSRDYTHISDIVRGIHDVSQCVKGFNIINLGSSSPITLNTLIEKLSKALKVTPIIQRGSLHSGDVHHTYADVSKAKHRLGWEPIVDFDDGLEGFVDWLGAQ